TWTCHWGDPDGTAPPSCTVATCTPPRRALAAGFPDQDRASARPSQPARRRAERRLRGGRELVALEAVTVQEDEHHPPHRTALVRPFVPTGSRRDLVPEPQLPNVVGRAQHDEDLAPVRLPPR